MSDWRSDWSNTADAAGRAVEESLLKSPPAQAELELKLRESPRLWLWCRLTSLAARTGLTPHTLRVEGALLRAVGLGLGLVLIGWLGEGGSEGEPGVERLQQVSPVQPD